MKKYISYWSIYELIWLVTFCAVAIWITIAGGDSPFGFFVFLSGVLCVVLVAKGSILNYPIGLFNTLGYAWLSWQNGFYGEVIEYLFFYLPMMVIGFLMWRKHIDDNGIVSMKKLSYRFVVLISIVCIAVTAGFGFILSLIETQNTPYIDAATNVLAISATILMVRRYREQWAAYIILNMLSIIMWALRIADGSPEGPLMVVMWSAYLVNSVYGFYNWTKGARQTEGSITI